MPFQTGLAAALRNRGLTVEIVPGAETRGSASFNPGGSTCHWTAGPRTGDRPSLKVCVNGRPGVPGPLCNVFLTRAGVAVVVACGRANHAGKGGWRGLVGNSAVWGTEAENSGQGEWTIAQRAAYPKVNAAYADLSRFGSDMVCGHHEWAPDRKIDIRDWPMSTMRASVQQLLAAQPIEDDDMPFTDRQLRDIAAQEATKIAQTITRAVVREELDKAFMGVGRVVANEETLNVVRKEGVSGAADPGVMGPRMAPHISAAVDASNIAQVVRQLSTGGFDGISDHDVQRLSAAVADEIDRRELIKLTGG